MVLTATAASGHLSYDTLCFVSLLFPFWSVLAVGPDNFFSPGSEPALGCSDDPPKRRKLLAQQYSVTSQKTYIKTTYPTTCLTSVFVTKLVRILTKIPTILVRWYSSQANARKSILK